MTEDNIHETNEKNNNNEEIGGKNDIKNVTTPQEAEIDSEEVPDITPKNKEESTISKLEQDNLDLKDKYYRTVAEMENIRRRTDKEIQNVHQYSLEKFFKAILPVLDSFDKALSFNNAENNETEESNESFISGVKLVKNQLMEQLENNGLTIVNTKGEEFNPELHQAIKKIETDKDSKKDKIAEEYQKGYTLNNRVIRAAMVSVYIEK